MENRIKIEYNRQRVANVIDGEEAGWTLGAGDESGFPTSSIVYVKSTGSDSNDGLTEVNAVKSIHVAVHKAVAGGLDNIIVIDDAEYSGTVDLKGKTVWLKNDATITRVALASKSMTYAGGVHSSFSDEILTPDGIFQAVLITEDSGGGRADLKIIKNRTQEVTTDISGTVSVPTEKEPAFFYNESLVNAYIRPILHWNGTRLLCFILDYNVEIFVSSDTYGIILREFEVNSATLVCSQSETYTFPTIYSLTMTDGSPKTTLLTFSNLDISFVFNDTGNVGRRVLCASLYAKFSFTASNGQGDRYNLDSDELERIWHFYGSGPASADISGGAHQQELIIINDGSTPDLIESASSPGTFVRYTWVWSLRGPESLPFSPQKTFKNAFYENESIFLPYPFEVVTDDYHASYSLTTESRGYISGMGFLGIVKECHLESGVHYHSTKMLYLVKYQDASLQKYYDTGAPHLVATSSDLSDNHNPPRELDGFWYSVREGNFGPVDFSGYTGTYRRIRYTDPVSSIKTTAGMKVEPLFNNGTVENIEEDATYPRSILHEGTLRNSTLSGSDPDFPACAVLRGEGDKNLIDSVALGIGSDDIENEIKNSVFINVKRAAGLATLKHCTIHKSLYAVSGAAVVEDSIIANCTGQYINESGVPMTIRRSVIQEALNQNLVPVDSALSFVKIGSPFFKSAVQPFNLHLRSVFANDPVSSPAIALSLTPSIHNAAIMREAGAYDDFYAASETWDSVTLDAPWQADIEPMRESSSNKLSDGRNTVGALSSPSAPFRLRWLAVQSETIKALQALIHADSMLVRIYFNPVSRPDVYLEGYITPRVKLGPPAAPVANVSEKPELRFVCQLPAGDIHSYL